MLSLALTLTAAAPTVIDAERAFAQMAQDKGQWTAFRVFAAPDAVMFTPQPVNAQEFLKPLKDPPKSVRWWPIQAWLSCDGTLAVDTGGAVWPDGHFSRYVTVWKRQANGKWNWVYDNGQDIAARPPEPQNVSPIQASCSGTIEPGFRSIIRANKQGWIASNDLSLQFDWSVDPSNAHNAYALVWDGNTFKPGATLTVPAPTK